MGAYKITKWFLTVCLNVTCCHFSYLLVGLPLVSWFGPSLGYFIRDFLDNECFMGLLKFFRACLAEGRINDRVILLMHVGSLLALGCSNTCPPLRLGHSLFHYLLLYHN